MTAPLPKAVRLERLAQRMVDRLEASYIPEPMSGCHLWVGNVIFDRGYAIARFYDSLNRKWEVAPRFVWRLRRGEIPDGGQILHRCDVSICVNDFHLYLGDPTQNVRDREQRGRGWRGRVEHMKTIQKLATPASGEAHSQARLTWADVDDIRTSQLSNRELAERYGVSIPHVWYIRAGRYWREETRPAASGARRRYCRKNARI